jgi:hypothetical protein
MGALEYQQRVCSPTAHASTATDDLLLFGQAPRQRPTRNKTHHEAITDRNTARAMDVA